MATLGGTAGGMSLRPLGLSGPEVVITPYRDGPLLVRGPFRLRDQEGRDIDVGRETVALCRCGKSRIRPFCDGTHKLTRFRAASGPETDRGNGARGTEDPAAGG
jgi:CDGSH-type Zn-finger protein